MSCFFYVLNVAEWPLEESKVNILRVTVAYISRITKTSSHLMLKY